MKKDGSFIGFDIGPGNGPIDSIVSNRLNLDFDIAGKISKKGKINYNISKKIVFEIEKLGSRRSYDRNTLDQICLKETII